MTPDADTKKESVVRVVREIDAPADRVYEAFVNPEMLARWMGQESSFASETAVDLRVGGRSKALITDKDGEARWFDWKFLEIEPGRRLVMDHTFSGAGIHEWHAKVSRLTLEFREKGEGTTELTLIHDRLPADASGVDKGWGDVLGRLVDQFKAGDLS